MRGTAPGLLVACSALSGCSLFFTQHTVLPVVPTDPVRCTESRAAPIADTAIAAGFAMAAVALVARGATEPPPNGVDCVSCFDFGFAAVAAGYALGAGAVAKVGYDRTSECQRVHEWQRRCLTGEREACAALQAPAP